MPRLPREVYEYVRSVFMRCDEQVSGKLSRIPTTHETSLDLSLIEALSQVAAPHLIGDSWTVQLETHYLGGGRHFGEWEVADIGFIIVWRDAGQVRARKSALLQAKRLYPVEQGVEEDTPIDYMIGFARLMQGDEALPAQEERIFSFTEESRYRALVVGEDQFRAIADYEKRHALDGEPEALARSQAILAPAARRPATRDV